MKRIADDFGFSEGIDAGILELAVANKLDGTSCMTGGSSFISSAPRLRLLKQEKPDFEIGLHLTLSEELLNPVSDLREAYPSKMNWLIKSQLGIADLAFALAELSEQWQRFVEAFGRVPDYIDGHEHLHLVPGVREILISFLLERKFSGWVRQCSVPTKQSFGLPSFFKVQVLNILSCPFLRACKKAGLKTNDVFVGAYDFKPGTYAEHWRKWSLVRGDNVVVMCHPSLPSLPDLEGDTIAAARKDEFEFLTGY